MSYTLQDLQSRIYARVDGNVALYPVTDVNTDANLAVQTVNLYTASIEDSVILPGWSVQNQSIYTMPSGFVYPTRLEFEGRPLRQFSLLELSRLFRSWATDTGVPRNWAAIDFQTFVLHPADSLGGRNLSITGILEPTAMAAPADPLPLEDYLLEAVENLSTSTLVFKEGASMMKTTAPLYQDFMRRMKSLSVWRMNVNPAFFVRFKDDAVKQQVPE